MSQLRDALNENNQKRLTLIQYKSRELFKLPDLPDEQIIITLALIFMNLIMRALSRGWIDMRIINPRNRDGIRYNLVDYFMINYSDQEAGLNEEKKKLGVN